MANYAFIFARGGSKGLPKKNIKPLCGIPLITHSINIAKQVSSIDRIFVSTDCPSIAKVAIASSVEVIDRPTYLATDTAKEWDAWKHAVLYVNSKYGPFDKFVSLPATAPLRAVDDVMRCLHALSKDIDIVLTMTPASRNPWFNVVKINSQNMLQKIIRDDSISRRQDAPECYDLTTVAYVTTSSYILKSSSIWAGNVSGIIIPKERAIDIDDYYDFVCAEALLRLKFTESDLRL